MRWMAYYNHEPFGAWRDNFHTATLCAMIANAVRGKGQAPLSFMDFMFVDEQTRQFERNARMMARFRARAEEDGDNTS